MDIQTKYNRVSVHWPSKRKWEEDKNHVFLYKYNFGLTDRPTDKKDIWSFMRGIQFTLVSVIQIGYLRY